MQLINENSIWPTYADFDFSGNCGLHNKVIFVAIKQLIISFRSNKQYYRLQAPVLIKRYQKLLYATLSIALQLHNNHPTSDVNPMFM